MSDQDKNLEAGDAAIGHALDAWTPMAPPADFADRVLSARTPLAPQIQRNRRAWLIAAPIAATAAMIALVLFATQRKEASSEGRRATGVAQEHFSANGAGASEPTGAYGSGSAVVMNGSAGVAMNQPVAADAGVATQTPTPTSVDDASTGIAIPAGTSATVHDPAPITALHIELGTRCPTGGTVTMLHVGATGPTATASGRTRAVFTLAEGTWTYEVRCESAPSTLAAQGTIRVVREGADRALPKKQAAVPIEADGRRWRISYQTDVPEVRVNAPGATFVHYTIGANELEIPVVNGVAKLTIAEGTYTYWSITPTGRGKTSTLIVDFDDTAPQVHLTTMKSSSSGGVVISGTTLPGIKLQIDGTPIDVDKQLRFFVRVGYTRVVIRAEHPQRGVHFYLTLPITK